MHMKIVKNKYVRSINSMRKEVETIIYQVNFIKPGLSATGKRK